VQFLVRIFRNKLLQKYQQGTRCATIEFFLFCEAKVFPFSFLSKKKTIPIYRCEFPFSTNAPRRAKNKTPKNKTWLFSCSLKEVGNLPHPLTALKFHSYKIKIYNILIKNDLDTVSPAVFFNFPLRAPVNRCFCKNKLCDFYDF
jgi:hypothetical protein